MSMDEETRKLILGALSSIHFKRVILFGSRARGDATKLSDYDLLVVMDEELTMPQKMELSGLVRSALVEKGIDADIILRSDKEIEYYKDKIGSVVREALKEGVVL